MDLDSATFRLSSPSGIGDLPLTSSLTTSGANHRRSSFTEYKSLLSSSLTGEGRPTATGTSSTTRPSYLSGLRDDPLLTTTSSATNNKYSSTYMTSTGASGSNYDKYSSGIHLDDSDRRSLHNQHSYQDHKYSFLDDASSGARHTSSFANQHPLTSTGTITTTSSLFNPTTTTFASSNATTAPPSSSATTSALPPVSKYTSSLSMSRQRTNAPLTGGVGSGSLMNKPTESSSSALLKRHMVTDELDQIHETAADCIEIPARGRCKVFMAKYGYDPFKQSPNDNPDAELAFNAGDYIMVFDDIDEDGYFIGELMDGRRGYVPSNWLYRLTGDDLFEFQTSVLYKQAGGSDNQPSGADHLEGSGGGLFKANQMSAALRANSAGDILDDCLLDNNCYPPEFYDAIISDTMNHSNFQHLLAPEDYHRMNDYVDLDDVNEVDDECLSDYERAEAEQMRRAVPPPQRLVLERQLNKCILIAWLHPQAAKGTIVSYQVYVDGVLKSTVPSGDRTKALLEGVDSNIPHRISVRAIDLHGRHSNDAGCTIVIGQRIPFAPSCVKASHITSDSALISWLPCNSNFHHVVAVNSVEVQTVRPGVYKHLINGLSANTLYRVWVRAKPGKILSIDEKNPTKLESLTTYVDFKTMPKSLPDPPVNVQVEAGPQRRTLLVTWLPLTLNDFGSSNGCAVTGYAVFAGHKKLAEIDSPTGDHALLDIGDLESLHKKSVTVRTKSGENLSQDSMPCQIPDEYLKATAAANAAVHHQTHHHSSSAHHHQQHANMATSATGHHHQQAIRHQNQTLSSSVSQSPSRQRVPLAANSLQRAGRYGAGLQSGARSSRALTRSLHNLESDLESRRSSIPAIEITRETSGSEMMNQTESYSEEEFENSMRFKGGSHRIGGRLTGGSRASGGTGISRFRARQSHSVDGHHQGPPFGPHQQLQSNRQYQSQANLANQRFRAADLNSAGDIRFFVALFDYDPSTMSPNPNAAAEELAFKEGSIIKVYGGPGEDGFYKGELVDTRATGYVPCNVISEINDPNLLASLYEKSNQLQLAAPGRQQQLQQTLGLSQSQQIDPMQPQQAAQTVTNASAASGAVKRMVALYDYDPQENSPNADTESEIPFKTGDIIFVYGKMDTDGFYMGEVERTKQRGLVPSNFLREEPLINKQQSVDNQQMMQMQQQQQLMGQPQMGVQFPNQQQMNPNFQQLRNTQPANLIRGANMMTNIGQQQQPQNINRPNSLSLGAQNAPQQQQQQMLLNNQQHQQMAMQMQQNGLAPSPQQQAMLQQQQQPANNMGGQFAGNMMGRGGVGGAGGMMMMGNMQQQGIGGQQMNLQRQQQLNSNQQQSGTSGVLSNLLSSGKQIIGAATTPRVPMQPGAFPGPAGAQQQAAGQLMGANSVNVGQPQSLMMTGNQMLDGTGVGNLNAANRINPQAQQQQLQGQSAMGAFNQQQSGHSDASHQQQQHNSFGMAGLGANVMGNQQQHMQQHQQPQQAYNQMGGGNFGRTGGMPGAGGMGMNQMGEEQGGNILNTVKNMFKL